MDVLLARVLGELLLPPASAIILLLGGMVAWVRRPRLARWLVALGTAALVLPSLPIVAYGLCRSVEVYPPLDEDHVPPRVGAIVILAGGWTMAPEYGATTVNDLTLERLRYGARLARRTGIAVIVSGGGGREKGAPEAQLMVETLAQDFGVAAARAESNSLNTAQSARNVAALLSRDGIRRIILVTHAVHMPRAVTQFRARGLEVIPAPMGFYAGGEHPWTFAALLPSAYALRWSYLALHEQIGRLWYCLRY